MQTLTRPDKKQSPQATPEGSGKRPPFKAAALFALALFLISNLVLFAVFGPATSYSNNVWNGTGSIDLALNEFKALPRRPDVVLLGSSLVMYPFWSTDKKEHPEIGDIFHHHRSLALEERLAQKDGKPVVFSMAIFGQMASDAYIYANEFLKGERKPPVLVWGVAPRDFYDAELSGPMQTISFQRLVGLDNLVRYADLYLPGFQERADFIFSKSVFLYGRRWHIQKEVNKGADKLYNLASPGSTVARPGWEKGQSGFVFTGTREDVWENSKQEYQKRYKNIDLDKLSLQMSFMDGLLKVCQERGIKVVLVNMPLTATNRDIMPAGFYDSYRSELSKIAGQRGAELADFGSDTSFEDGDYWDTCHLSYQGGFKLMDKLAPIIDRLR
ncbi:MAG: hypothetical protein KC777_25335 [Cyanobacteria bacterium HKST-UBA02]|nr:hypothetical protein [Cyanobacteria bacterium HKST-UBA02]